MQDEGPAERERARCQPLQILDDKCSVRQLLVMKELAGLQKSSWRGPSQCKRRKLSSQQALQEKLYSWCRRAPSCFRVRPLPLTAAASPMWECRRASWSSCCLK